MVKKREFWGLYKYHQDDDTYQNHMRWVEMGGTSTHKGIDMPKNQSLMTQKLSVIAKSETSDFMSP